MKPRSGGAPLPKPTSSTLRTATPSWRSASVRPGLEATSESENHQRANSTGHAKHAPWSGMSSMANHISMGSLHLRVNVHEHRRVPRAECTRTHPTRLSACTATHAGGMYCMPPL
jgi:hypothetical protein